MSDPNEHYADGTHDGHSGDYNPPHSQGDFIMEFNSDRIDEMAADNRAYDDGRYYAAGQDAQKVGNYDPPTLHSEDREAYDKGWESSRGND